MLLMGSLLLFATSCKEEKEEDKVGLPIVSTTAVTDITDITANSGGDITSDGGAPITARGVCWSTSQAPTISDYKTTDGTGVGKFTSLLSDLSPNTTYYVRAYATNSKGTSYGSAISLTTLQEEIVGTFVDPRDKTEYSWVKIGNQVWMTENLKYLPSVGPDTISETEPYYYVYGYYGTDVNAAKITESYKTYGVLYNWKAALISCPKGWHLPSSVEWHQLVEYLGGEKIAGGKLKETDTTHWNSPNIGATDEIGFTALPGGNGSNGNFYGIGKCGDWWSTTVCNYGYFHYPGSAMLLTILYSSTNAYMVATAMRNGSSVRCLRD